jgi:hypothetical protein
MGFPLGTNEVRILSAFRTGLVTFLQILTEFNAPRRWPSGMLVRCISPIFPGAETMIKSSLPANAPVVLPPLLAAFVEATNGFDVERLMATFAEDALVND